jgi:hypothetical protein
MDEVENSEEVYYFCESDINNLSVIYFYLTAIFTRFEQKSHPTRLKNCL